MTQKPEVLAVVRASAPRRWLAVGMMAVLGGLLLMVAVTEPPELGWQVFLFLMGGGSIWMADRLRRATEGWLELTADGIRDSSGHMVVALKNVTKVERGMFAFKPSNGFLIHADTKMERAWHPGLWWRLGKRVAVGGVTPGSQTKMMSEILAAMLMERDEAGKN